MSEEAPTKSVYVKNYPRSWKSRDLFDLFDERVGPVDRIDLKEGYAFVIFKDAIADDAVRDLNDYEADGNRLLVEVSRGKESLKKEDGRSLKRNKVLFVVNFDKERTREADVRDFFKDFEIEEVEMWRGGKGIEFKNYCFVTMVNEDIAEQARNALDGQYLGDRQVTVEFKSGSGDRRRDDRRSDRRDDYSRSRDYDRRDRRDDHGRSRDYDRRDDYGRGGRDHGRRDDYGRGSRDYDRRDDRRDDYGRGSRDYDRRGGRDYDRRDDYGRGRDYDRRDSYRR